MLVVKWSNSLQSAAGRKAKSRRNLSTCATLVIRSLYARYQALCNIGWQDVPVERIWWDGSEPILLLGPGPP